MVDSKNMRHFKSLDGFRGIAVLLVMFFHFGWFAAGWAGVQIFFVLSGYLITNALLTAKPKPFTRFLSTFHWHRTLRIFPVLYAFLLACGVLYAFTGAPMSFPAEWPWLVTFTANFARLRPADVGPAFIHIWSLAVEQQFYILWPFLVYFAPARIFKLIILGIILCTPLIRWWVFDAYRNLGFGEEYAGVATYVLPISQFDAFAAGALVTLWSTARNRHVGAAFLLALTLTAGAGIAKLAYEYLHASGAFLSSLGYEMYLIRADGFVWGYTAINIVSMLAISCLLRGIGPIRFFENRLLVWCGKISYGAYVYHVPLLLMENALLERIGVQPHGMFRALYFIGWLATVAVTAAASYRWLERPLLKLKNYWERPADPLTAVETPGVR